MRPSYKRILLNAANSILSIVGFKMIRLDKDFGSYISLRATIENAKKAGLSVSDYVEAKHNVLGTTQQTIAEMSKFGVFAHKIDRICEIGPGSGRYLEKTIRTCKPTFYEIYETSTDWAKWLAQTYRVISQPTDGQSLSHTPTCSIDLVHAHKVFPGVPVIAACHYFVEMVRVVREGGKVVFDILSEECLDESTLQRWFASGAQYANTMITKQYAIDFFCNRGFSLDGSFFVPMKPGITQYLIFTKTLTQ